MSSHGAGVADDSSPSSSRGHGQSGAADARPPTSPNSLDDALDALAYQRVPRHANRCQVGEVMKALPPETAERLIALIDQPRPDGYVLSAGTIAKALQDAGHDIGMFSIQRHRRRFDGNGCRCD